MGWKDEVEASAYMLGSWRRVEEVCGVPWRQSEHRWVMEGLGKRQRQWPGSRRAFVFPGLLTFLVSFDFGETEAKVTRVVWYYTFPELLQEGTIFFSQSTFPPRGWHDWKKKTNQTFLCFVPLRQGLHVKHRSLTGGGQFSLDSK